MRKPPCGDWKQVNAALEPGGTEQPLPSLRDEILSLDLVQFASHPVHQVPTYFLQITHTLHGDRVGSINLRVSADEHIRRHAGHVGYVVHQAFRGRRYASRALILLKPLARQLGVDPLSITCDPENAASRRTCEIAGAVLVEVVDLPKDCVIRRYGHPRKCIYRLPV
jgi:tagatose 1,6-diphosphate aldolase